MPLSKKGKSFPMKKNPHHRKRSHLHGVQPKINAYKILSTGQQVLTVNMKGKKKTAISLKM